MTSPLRAWQTRAIDRYFGHRDQNFLIVATPGAGKTRVAGEIMLRERAAERINFLVVVTPTTRLKFQWAAHLAALGVQINPEHERADFSAPAGDFHGLAVTYHQVAMARDLFRVLSARKRTLVVLDEIHHCGDERAWGDAIEHAFEPAQHRLGLSGTPFRTDNNKIPFVRYVDGQGVSDFAYDYGEALSDGVCRPIWFPRMGGKMEWSPAPGKTVTATFDDILAEREQAHRLRTAVHPDGNWIRQVLSDAHQQLSDMRHDDRDAAGLVIADSKEHAEKVARVLKQLGPDPVIVTSDFKDANERIEAFARDSCPWLVAVNMVSEGVDIPRLRVGVYATVRTTELFFRQAVGRLVRMETDTDDQTAAMFIPDDERLRVYADKIREQVLHHLDDETEKLTRELGENERPPSIVIPISSEAISKGVLYDDYNFTPEELAHAERVKMGSLMTASLTTVAAAAMLRLGQIPGAAPVPAPAPAEEPLHVQKKRLRKLNNNQCVQIGLSQGIKFAEVNMRLNRAVGITTIAQADVPGLQRRLAAARAWRQTGILPEQDAM